MDIEAQYGRFIAQLRVEVEQTFWLYNFFFAIQSALLGAFFLEKISRNYSVISMATGLILSIFWMHIMTRKDEWRRHWLERIREFEKCTLKIPTELQMWPKNARPRPGLWETLFLLPKGFVAVWLVMLIFHYSKAL